MDHANNRSTVTTDRNGEEGICVSNEFPAGLRVLVVDDDQTCLLILEKMLRSCLYEVTKCRQARDALSLLREDRNRFDIVVSDLHMPDMDGLKLLEIVAIEMDLPVVMMSADDENEVILKGVLHGACDYLIKPIRMDALKVLWQHVLRKRRNALKELEGLPAEAGRSGIEGGQQLPLKNPDNGAPDQIASGNGENANKIIKRGREDEVEGTDQASDDVTTGKKRMVWTADLHEKFIRAVNYLGHEKAVPTKILECMKKMNVPDITRENIASHLQMKLTWRNYMTQKYRGHLKNQDKNARFTFPKIPNFASILEQSPSLNVAPQLCATTSQFPAQSHPIQQASSGPVTLIGNSTAGVPLCSEINLPHSKMQAPSYFSLDNTAMLAASCNNVSSAGSPFLGEEYGYRSQGSTSHGPPLGDFYETKAENMPQLMYEPPLYLQHFDQSEIFYGPLMESIAPLPIEYNSSWQPSE